MRGFPPAAGDRWTLERWQYGPENRWSFQHMREIVPTARVSRGDGPPTRLETGRPYDQALAITRSDGTTSTIERVLGDTDTDGFLALAGGEIRAEHYANGMSRSTPHMLFSVSKSIVGSVCGILADRGKLDLDAPLTSYVDELASSGYAGATVRHLLDMRSGIEFSEDYLDPSAEVRVLEQVIGWAPRTATGLPDSMYEWLATLKAKSEHGGAFEYRSCEADVLGWVCERASGVRMPDLISELLWAPLRAEFDMDAGVDRAGAVMHDGGLAATLRDLGRFGLMIADGGVADGTRVVPAWWIEDTAVGGADSRTAFAAMSTEPGLEGGMYRNQFWVPDAAGDVLMCLGIHGQMVYVDRSRNFVGVKLSSWPYPEDDAMFLDTLALMRALAAA